MIRRSIIAVAAVIAFSAAAASTQAFSDTATDTVAFASPFDAPQAVVEAAALPHR